MLDEHVLPLSALESLVQKATRTPPPLTLSEIAGGASARRFFRIQTEERGSVIAMFVPVQSHELGRETSNPARWPFLEVRDLLEAHGVRVPRLLAEACDDGLLLVEDLGETLAQHLLHHPEDREPLYASAIRDLARAQRALSPLPADSVVVERAFDRALLRSELDHFLEWGLLARGVTLSADDRTVFDRAADLLAETIAAWPRGFVHRDFQSRNLMVVSDMGGELTLGWIDFQDALLGPRIYDVVALLSDSYQTFSNGFVGRRLDEFALHLGLPEQERAQIDLEFQMVTVQRKLKDAGRFVYIDRKLKNPGFLAFVEPTVQKARNALAALQHEPALEALAALLDRCFLR